MFMRGRRGRGREGGRFFLEYIPDLESSNGRLYTVVISTFIRSMYISGICPSNILSENEKMNDPWGCVDRPVSEREPVSKSAYSKRSYISATGTGFYG
jgi:hypothetical protein